MVEKEPFECIAEGDLPGPGSQSDLAPTEAAAGDCLHVSRGARRPAAARPRASASARSKLVDSRLAGTALLVHWLCRNGSRPGASCQVRCRLRGATGKIGQDASKMAPTRPARPRRLAAVIQVDDPSRPTLRNGDANLQALFDSLHAHVVEGNPGDACARILLAGSGSTMAMSLSCQPAVSSKR